MNYIKELYMEYVRSASLDGIEAIEKNLKNKKIILTEKQIDDIYLAIESELEKISNGDYKNHL